MLKAVFDLFLVFFIVLPYWW